MGQFENLANNANGSLSPVDSVILANSDDAMEYEDGESTNEHRHLVP